MIKNILSIAVLAIFLTSCKSTKKSTNINENNNDISAQQKTSTILTSKENSSVDSEEVPGGVAAQVNGSTGAMNNVQASTGNGNVTNSLRTNSSSSSMDNQMFTDLGMTDEQISAYKTAIEKFNSKKRNMANGDMLGSVESERSRQMKAILSDDQFTKFQNWEAKNK
ncbi:hypothetical protein D9O36_20935 [Zobellia amurskyensis]|uniref:Lipoprotein n=1 Tax=Zobellia amurskyensis TaxID=248905 RepID=A0A7X2ZXN9_9FLAO|nr:hypothetical protein [Zobellia amurskyensis]MUH38322.1 hypothetical protein [Zobellia amurskyensis]